MEATSKRRSDELAIAAGRAQLSSDFADLLNRAGYRSVLDYGEPAVLCEVARRVGEKASLNPEGACPDLDRVSGDGRMFNLRPEQRDGVNPLGKPGDPPNDERLVAVMVGHDELGFVGSGTRLVVAEHSIFGRRSPREVRGQDGESGIEERARNILVRPVDEQH